MMNVFGKTHEQYQHLSKLRDKGLLDSHLNALRTSFVDAAEPAQGFGFGTNNLQAIQSEIEEVLYLNFRLDKFVPINNAIAEGANSYAYRVKNQYGEANFIDSYGKNAQSADVSYELLSSVILQGGIDAMWSLQEVRSANFAGIPLQTDTIDAATRACMNHIEKVGLVGDASKGFEGLTNNSDIPTETAATTLANASDAADYINDYINKVIVDTNTIASNRITTGLTVYLPVTQFNFLATKKYSDVADKSVMDYLKTFNAWTAQTGNPIMFESVIEFAGAGAGSADRMLIGFNEKSVMEMGNPIMPRVINLMNEGRYFRAPLEYSISQLNVKRPGACLYVDGV
jgi:hypothetical protein